MTFRQRWDLKATTATAISAQSLSEVRLPSDHSTNKPWGVRTAYFKGPGELKFEIEGPIENR